MVKRLPTLEEVRARYPHPISARELAEEDNRARKAPGPADRREEHTR